MTGFCIMGFAHEFKNGQCIHCGLPQAPKPKVKK